MSTANTTRAIAIGINILYASLFAMMAPAIAIVRK